MKRFLVFLTLLSLLVPLAAHAVPVAGRDAKFGWHALFMRNTTGTASTVFTNVWGQGSPGAAGFGFTDSTVFRCGATTNTDRDTSAAYPLAAFFWPPHLSDMGAGTTTVLDTTGQAHMPWVALRVRQDSTSYSFSGTCTMDSIYVAAQISYDGGVNWVNVNGTPTRTFETTNGAATADGSVPVLIGPIGEPFASADVATLYLNCVPVLIQTVANSGYILDRTLCTAGDNVMVRFLINLDGSGQWATDIGYWSSGE